MFNVIYRTIDTVDATMSADDKRNEIFRRIPPRYLPTTQLPKSSVIIGRLGSLTVDQ